MASSLHISLAAEPIGHIGSFPITNSLLVTWIAMAILILLAVLIRRKVSLVPKGLQNFFEIIVDFFLDLIQSVTQSKKQTYAFFPLIFTFFIFILVSNYLGLIPGVGTLTITPKEEAHEVATKAHAATPTLVPTKKATPKPTPVKTIAKVAVGDKDTTHTATDEDDSHTPIAIHIPEAVHIEEDTHTNDTVDTHAVVDTAHTEDTAHNATTDAHGAEEGEHGEEGGHHGAVPILRPPNADLNATLAWSLISVLAAQIFGMSALGFFGYAGKFFPFHRLFVKKGRFWVPSFMGFIEFFIGLLETLSEFAKIISFSFRLFGNIFAGEVLLTVIAFLAAYVAPLPFYGLELFVGLIQALVFAMLTLVFFKIATLSHGDDH